MWSYIENTHTFHIQNNTLGGICVGGKSENRLLRVGKMFFWSLIANTQRNTTKAPRVCILTSPCKSPDSWMTAHPRALTSHLPRGDTPPRAGVNFSSWDMKSHAWSLFNTYRRPGVQVCVSDAVGRGRRCGCSPLTARGGSRQRAWHAHAGLSYLSAVLQALQHGQVVGPGVFGAQAGQVLPAGLLLRELPPGRPSRLWGRSGGGGRCISDRGLSGSVDGRVGRLGRAAGSLKAEDGAEAAETRGQQQQQQQQLRATVRRHLHTTEKLAALTPHRFPSAVHN